MGPGFRVEGSAGGRADVRGIAVDADRRLWAADAGSASLRAFAFSGREVDGLRTDVEADADRPGALGDLAAIAVEGVEDRIRFLVARGGHRRHALFHLEPSDGAVRSLPSLGDPERSFSSLNAVGLAGDLAYACESGTGSVQVFRRLEFHFRAELPRPAGGAEPLEPRGIAPLGDGRMVIACGGRTPGAVVLLDPGGRLLRVLADGSDGDALVRDPSGVVAVEGSDDRGTRIVVLDSDGDRVQVLDLDGRRYGEFIDEPGGVLEEGPARIRVANPSAEDGTRAR